MKIKYAFYSIGIVFSLCMNASAALYKGSAVLTVKPEKVADVKKAVSKIVAPTRKESANLSYDAFQVVDKDGNGTNRFEFHEVWQSENAMKVDHIQNAPHMKEFFALIGFGTDHSWVEKLEVSGNPVNVLPEPTLKFPRFLNCGGSLGSDPDILYTRLEKFHSLDELPAAGKAETIWGNTDKHNDVPFSGELAAQYEGDSYSIAVDQQTFSYSGVTCDTTDVRYEVPIDGLVLPFDSKLKTKKVIAQVTVSVRADDKHSSTECQAYY